MVLFESIFAIRPRLLERSPSGVAPFAHNAQIHVGVGTRTTLVTGVYFHVVLEH